MQEQRELLLESAKIPALSMGWCQQGKTQVAAFGCTDKSAPQPVDTSTLFQAASLSKPVSAAIVLDLVEQGKWNLDQPLYEYGPYGSPEIQKDPNYKTLTTRMVIGQCSGLPNWFEEGNAEKFIATPNTQFTYSGVALYFLKQVIEASMQEKWENLAQKFFTKAGMQTSTFKPLPNSHLSETPGISLARAHLADGTPLPLAPDHAPEIPAGSLLTTGNDYINFLQYCYNNENLRSKLLTGALSTLPPTASENVKVQWGLGMGVCHDSASNQIIAFHWGNNTGSIAFCAMNMKTGDCVVSFANSDNGPKVFQQVAEPIVGDVSTLFQWLAKYCQFYDRSPQDPQSTAKLAEFAYSSAEKGQATEVTHHYKQSLQDLQNSNQTTETPADTQKLK